MEVIIDPKLKQYIELHEKALKKRDAAAMYQLGRLYAQSKKPDSAKRAFADGANPDALTPEQVAELLYVAHMWSPLRGIDFPPLRNAFIYLSHDDTHTLKLFYTNPAAARDVLLRLVQFSLSQSGGTPMPAFPTPTADALMELLQTGVLVRAVDGAHIRLTEVGKTEDMDALWNRKNILAEPVRTLSLSSEGWTIV